LTLTNNQLTSFNGTGLSNLVELDIQANSLTSFNKNGLSNLNILGLGYNQLTSVDVTGLSNLTILGLSNNQLTSLNVFGLTNLERLLINENPMTQSANDSILNLLNYNSVNDGTFTSINGRSFGGTADYNSLISRGWTLTGLYLSEVPETGVARTGIRG
jgi:Leucine-rich repeat (LRR) protein